MRRGNVGIRSVDFHIPTRRVALCRPRIPCGAALRRAPSAFYSRFSMSESIAPHHGIRVGRGAILVTALTCGHRPNRAPVPAVGSASPLRVTPRAYGSARRRPKLRPITPHRVEHARQPTGERDNRNPPAAPRGERLRPHAQRGPGGTPPTPDHPTGLDQQRAQVARAPSW